MCCCRYALHRSLLVSPHRALSPSDADFFFVPLYARLAYADKVASRAVRRMQANLTSTLAACLRASPSWRASEGRDHMVAISSTRDPRKLFGRAWPLLRRAVQLRIEAVDHRYERKRRPAAEAYAVLPYYVPHFAEDDAVVPAAKTHSVRPSPARRPEPQPRQSPDTNPPSNPTARPAPCARTAQVCFFGSATNGGLRKRALKALGRVPGAMLRLTSFQHFNGSTDALDAQRRRTAGTRRALRSCKLCLVPAGMTPSSRRFYEALVAKCVPLLLADRFEPASTKLLPTSEYAVRAKQARRPEHAPTPTPH